MNRLSCLLLTIPTVRLAPSFTIESLTAQDLSIPELDATTITDMHQTRYFESVSFT